MENVPPDILFHFDAQVMLEQIVVGDHVFYRKWLRFYFDFCHEYQLDPDARSSLTPFLRKLADKKHSSQLCRQAEHALLIFYALPKPSTNPLALTAFPLLRHEGLQLLL